MISKSILNLIFCSLVSMAGVALASGTHSTGHGHDNETIGKPGEASQVNRTVNIEMNDAMRFIPDNTHSQTGRDYSIRGEEHQAKWNMNLFWGLEKELEEHNKLMREIPWDGT